MTSLLLRRFATENGRPWERVGAQDGLQVVQSLASFPAMMAFVKRMVLEERGEVVDQQGGAN